MSGIEQPQRVGVREHEAGDVRVENRLERFDVDQAVLVAGDRDGLVPAHRDGGRVGAVRRVGNHDLLARVAGSGVSRTKAHQGSELAVRTGGRLQRHARKPRDLGQRLLKPEHELERTLHARREAGSGWMPEKPSSRLHVLVDARVVLHRARAERVHARSRHRSSSRQGARSGA